MQLPDGWSPYSLAAAPDGSIWMTLLSPEGLARLAPDGSLEFHPAGARPMVVTVVADGTPWWTRTDDRLCRLDSEVELPAGAGPYGIAAAPDGSIWFTAPGTDQIGFVRDGTVSLIDLPVPKAFPAMVTVTAGGVVWVALNAAGALARWADGELDIIDLPAGRAPAAPVGVAAAGEEIWYADISGGCVGRVGSTRVEFEDPACRPHAVVADPDGGCWVTLWGSNRLAHVTASGAVTEFPLDGKEPHGLTRAGGKIWVAMESGSLETVG